MDMSARAALFVFLTAGCASDVDLQLDLGSDTPSAGGVGALRAARVLGGPGDMRVIATAWHPDSLVIAAGDFDGTIDLGAGSVTEEIYRTGFVATYDLATVEPVWVRTFLGSPDTDAPYQLTMSSAMDVVVTSDGVINVAGEFSQTIDFGTGPFESTDGCLDGVIARYTVSGAPLEPFILPKSTLYAVAATPNGDLVTSGYEITAECPWLGGGNAPTQAFVARLDRTGHVVWKHYLGSDANADGIAVTPEGDVLVQGVFWGEVVVGDLSIDADPGQHMFFARLSGEGTPMWLSGCIAASRASSCTHDAGFAVADGQVLFVGNATGQVDFAGSAIDSAGREQVFLADLDDHGHGNVLATSDAGIGRSIAVRDHPFEVVMAGDGAADIFPGPFLGIFAGGTTLVSARGMSMPPYSWGQAWDVAIGPAGEIALVGAFHGDADFGDGPVHSEADAEDEGDDGFVAIYDREVVENAGR